TGVLRAPRRGRECPRSVVDGPAGCIHGQVPDRDRRVPGALRPDREQLRPGGDHACADARSDRRRLRDRLVHEHDAGRSQRLCTRRHADESRVRSDHGVLTAARAAPFALALASLALAGQAGATATARMGIQDDAWLRWGPGTLESRLDTLDTLGVKTVRFTLLWNEVATKKPANAANPNDPAYDWTQFDPVLDGLRAHGITPLVTLYGSPTWANGGRAPNYLPTSGFGQF